MQALSLKERSPWGLKCLIAAGPGPLSLLLDFVATMNSRSLVLAGLAALTPAAFYAAASGHGRPFMLARLFHPESSHTAIGLALLAIALVVSPLLGVLAGSRLWRRGRRALAVALIAAALALLATGLSTQQPYGTEWALGPAAGGSLSD